MPRKYRLLWPKEVTLPNGRKRFMHRIKATCDIPRHGVKKGDLGGYVSGKKILSQLGSGWIGGNAMVEAGVEGELPPRKSLYRKDDAMITGYALITDNAHLIGTFVEDAVVKDNAELYFCYIEGDAEISGDADLEKVSTYGNVKIQQSAWAVDSKLQGDILLDGRVEVRGCTFDSGGHIRITENAQCVGGSVITYKDAKVMVGGDSILQKTDEGTRFTITAPDHARIHIDGSSVFSDFMISGDFFAAGNVKINNSKISGVNELIGDISLLPGVSLTGKTRLEGDIVLPKGNYINGIPSASKYAVTAQKQEELPAPKANPAVERYISVIQETLGEYESYTTDIIKLIKYPAMADASVLETQSLLVAIKRAKRAMEYPEELETLKKASDELEHAFVLAETKAKAIALEYLDDKTKNSLKKADAFIALACNDAASDQEKRSSIKATLNSLTGIFEISDAAIDNLKAQVGVLELEA